MAGPVIWCVMNILVDTLESNTISWLLMGPLNKHNSYTPVYIMAHLEVVYIRVYETQISIRNILVISDTKYICIYFFPSASQETLWL